MSKATIFTAKYLAEDGREKAVARILHSLSDEAKNDPRFVEAQERGLRMEIAKDLGYTPAFDAVTYYHWSV